jgi:TonB-linked SusC/RagA family outer membrane protein
MNSSLNQRRLSVSEKLFFSFIIFLVPLLFFAQKIQVKGVIIDEITKVAIPSVNVLLKNSTISTISDENGKYQINANNGDILMFSSFGYKTIEKKITGSILNISLQEDIKSLAEVVVIGYGTSKKKDLTGSISTISSKDFNKVPVTNVEGLIASKIPGIQITPTSGKPGAGSSILIRGGASLNASNDPLYVIDGVPVEGKNGGPGILSQLNPNDIESFTILKDASAAAIYGSRASNGVVIITTKKGSLKETQFNLSSNTRVSQVIRQASVLSGDQYREVVNKLIAQGLTPKTLPGVENTNWQDEIFQLAVAKENNISLSGALAKIPYRISGGYLEQDGVLKTGSYKRVTALLNLSPKLFNNHLKVNLNLKGSQEDERIANDLAIWHSRIYDPTQPVYVADQTFGGYFQHNVSPSLSTVYNPVSSLEQVFKRNKINRSVGNIQLDYSLHFLPDLHLNLNVGYDVSRAKYRTSELANYYGQSLSGGGYIYNADPSKDINNKLLESYLFYSKDLKSIKSRFDFTAGYSYNDFLTTEYFYPTYRASDGGKRPGTDPVFTFDKPTHSIISFYGRLNYIFNEKYLLTASLREDGSSRFSEKNRWGLFPSVAFAWKLKEEGVFKNSKIFSDLKLRLGHGVTGQQDFVLNNNPNGNYYFNSYYNTGFIDKQYTFGNTPYITVTPAVFNPDLKWEQTASSNIGLDFGFLKNRITGSVDLYLKRTKDLLNETIVPHGSTVDPYSKLLINVGTMENKGVEFILKAIPIQTDNLTWDVNFNITYNENRITKLNNFSDEGVGLFSDKSLVNTVGFPRNSFYLYHQVYDDKGMPIEGQMLDVNNDGLINANDRYVSNKSTAPKYLMGFSTNFQYKKWNLNTTFHANIGNYLVFQPYHNITRITQDATSSNLSTLYYDTLFSHNNNVQTYSDFYLNNASFLKMDNINISYNLGNSFFNSKIGMNVNFSVQNVFTLTKYRGLDPEALTTGGDENSYPIPRVFALGMNINFN